MYINWCLLYLVAETSLIVVYTEYHVRIGLFRNSTKWPLMYMYYNVCHPFGRQDSFKGQIFFYFFKYLFLIFTSFRLMTTRLAIHHFSNGIKTKENNFAKKFLVLPVATTNTKTKLFKAIENVILRAVCLVKLIYTIFMMMSWFCNTC